MNTGRVGKNGNQGNDLSGRREHHKSPDSQNAHRLLPPRGDYQTLLSYQKAEVVYDLTFRFAHKFLQKNDRTIDQMIQSARSGKQNILEGSKAASTSKETEIKLTNVARASLEELLADYRDFLRVEIWPFGAKIQNRRSLCGNWDELLRRYLISTDPMLKRVHHR
jgi:four helix bundle protein